MALISGAIADRAKFGAWMVFTVVWATIVYFPVAHWVFAFDGFAADDGRLDRQPAQGDRLRRWHGGAHQRRCRRASRWRWSSASGVGFGKEPMRPHNLTLVMIGAGLLWFGWFGFNAGSALGANGTAAVAWVNTLVATGAAALGWLVTEKIRDGHATSLGAASGVVAGLVAITPACSSVTPVGAIVVGVVAGVLCALAVGLKFRFGFDDSLDVVGVHLVGGLVGTLAIGFLATAAAPAGVDGLFYGGGVDQLWRQAVGAFAVLAFSFVAHLRHRPGAAQDASGFRIDRGRRGRRHRPAASTLRRRTTSAPSAAAGSVPVRATATRPPVGTHAAPSAAPTQGASA